MGKKITVLIATGTMNAGGAETLIMEMLRQKTDRINYIMLIHYSGKKEVGVYDEEIRSLGVPIVYIPSVGSVGTRKYIKEFEGVIKKSEYVDIIHSHLNGVGGIIARAAKKVGIQNRIVHCHADISFRGNKFNIYFNELKLAYLKMNVNKYANYYWACSEAAGKRLFSKDKEVKIIPNVIDVRKYLMTDEKVVIAKDKFGMKGQFVIGSIGRIARVKNYELVIQLLAELKKTGMFAQFVCFGRVVDKEYFEELTQLAEPLGVEEQVHFLGNSTEVSNDIGCFDIFVMPSHSEGFGMAAIEAQAAGLPTLVSEGVPDIVDVDLGLVKSLPLDNIQRWADAVRNIGEFAKPNHSLIIDKFNDKGFNSEAMVRNIEEQYIEMQSGRENGN